MFRYSARPRKKSWDERSSAVSGEKGRRSAPPCRAAAAARRSSESQAGLPRLGAAPAYRLFGASKASEQRGSRLTASPFGRSEERRVGREWTSDVCASARAEEILGREVVRGFG